MTVDLELSRRLRDEVRATDKECFYNSIMATMALARDEPDVRYVEGFVVAADFPVVAEHGWVEVGDRIVDPTPVYCDGATERRYFGGAHYTPADLRRRVFARGKATLPLVGSWWKQAAMRGAHESALRFAVGDEAYDRIRRTARDETAHF